MSLLDWAQGAWEDVTDWGGGLIQGTGTGGLFGAGGAIGGTIAGGPVGGMVGGAVGNAVGGLFGPSYNSANGGEVQRQINTAWTAGGDWGPYVEQIKQAYYRYLQTFFPTLWQTGDIWDVPQTLAAGHPTPYMDAYIAVVRSGQVGNLNHTENGRAPGSFAILPSGELQFPDGSIGAVNNADERGNGNIDKGKASTGLVVLVFILILIWACWPGKGATPRTKADKL